jgi:hypothetical protein
MDVSALTQIQDDFQWEIHEVCDMTEPENQEIKQMTVDMQYFDENTWEPLDPKAVEQGEKEELARFRTMGVYEYVSLDKATNDPEGKFVKVKWVRINKGSREHPQVKCRLVAQELGYGQRMDELFSGTPSLLTLRLVLLHAAKGGRNRGLMILDVKCAFLYGECRRVIYIELPTQDPQYGGEFVGVLRKAMYGTRDAPQIWAAEVQCALEGLGFQKSVFQPSVYYHSSKNMVVTVHVDDFLVSGDIADLDWLYRSIQKKYDLKRSVLSKSEPCEGHYLNRCIRWTGEEFEIEGDPKHAQLLKREWGMESCKPADTPITKQFAEEMNTGDPLGDEEARKARRAIARVNYMAQDRPDLSVAARVLSQGMAHPHEGINVGIKRVIRYLAKCPRSVLKICPDEKRELDIWTDSDWAGDLETRRSCSGGMLFVHGVPLLHWSKLQSNVALSSGEAELNASVKAMSEGIGCFELLRELCGQSCRMFLCTDASACKGILLRQGAGRIKHLSVKCLWAQGAIDSFGVTVVKVARDINVADVLTHPVPGIELRAQLVRAGYHFPL